MTGSRFRLRFLFEELEPKPIGSSLYYEPKSEPFDRFRFWNRTHLTGFTVPVRYAHPTALYVNL